MLRNPLNELCQALGIQQTDLGGIDVLLLPENIFSAESTADLYDTSESLLLAKHLKARGLNCKTAFDLGSRPSVKDRRAIDIWLGVVWITNRLAIPVLVTQLNEFIKKHRSDKTDTAPPKIHVNLRLQDGDRVSSLTFDGSAEDFRDVISGLRAKQGRIE